ncbi:unnamed protein product [Paramecium sonneborni]|uniref:Uncharacterized protein n=1 Tax=Paramecium sonneborni TaxID=65129 RepID=A0A8S1RNP3_9CILI|nr:unnamed protein product [Paramecium sonneborni]
MIQKHNIPSLKSKFSLSNNLIFLIQFQCINNNHQYLNEYREYLIFSENSSVTQRFCLTIYYHIIQQQEKLIPTLVNNIIIQRIILLNRNHQNQKLVFCIQFCFCNIANKIQNSQSIQYRETVQISSLHNKKQLHLIMEQFTENYIYQIQQRKTLLNR